MSIYNKLRSKAHKKYNQIKQDYQYFENMIVKYKSESTNVNPKLLEKLRANLKRCVEYLKFYKSQMKRYNREWNNDEELMKECCNMRHSQHRINELYNKKYGSKRNM